MQLITQLIIKIEKLHNNIRNKLNNIDTSNLLCNKIKNGIKVHILLFNT